MKNVAKNVWMTIVISVLLNSLYIIVPWWIVGIKEIYMNWNVSYTFFWFTYLTVWIFCIQTILVFLYFFRWFLSRKILLFFGIIFLIHTILAVIPFTVCSSGFSKKSHVQCECIWLKKITLFQKQCVWKIKSSIEK